ncbi:hypothetical protein CONCODRAFT_11108 [Conidiobolus coronatus NRRL 28638]|uniref:Secreted protein n=1 Tax=Conidiobolus coronatus (strain ATCC 28846 / CBS 209.66 / NRRL 28638) TaxID=796925 RepID=A0A137NW76_CONC2|nr:hypothetical protein CONCODRAFT_11108 [Conidiobolus coronatus NRRL 28638]|eukprot:KXN66938.1 hypothetical protein CONCODRAFT_11108 [Conidiobolus coronatus NRRL 28638]
MKLPNSLLLIGALITQLHANPTEPHKQEKKKPAQCYGGGMEQYPPLSGKDTPPCCKECPWPGYEDPKPK